MTTDEYLSTQMQSGERIIEIIRRHGVITSPAVVGGAALVCFDFFLLAWFFAHAPIGPIGFVLLAVVGALLIGRSLFIWRKNLFVVTNQRVIYVDQRGVFEQHVSEVAYANMKDVRYSIRGVWGTMFRFGTLTIQCAGVNEPLNVMKLPRPQEVQRLVVEQQRTATVRHESPTSHVLDVRRKPEVRE